LECRRASVFHVNLLDDYKFCEELHVMTSIADVTASLIYYPDEGEERNKTVIFALGT
jgi:hypothetical protein